MTRGLQNSVVRRWTWAALLLLIPSAIAFTRPPEAAQSLWSFDEGVENQWGGQYNPFSREPSWARTYLDSRVHPANSRYSLRVTAHRATQGFCGVWLQFYPAGGAPRRFLDASSFRYLSFWVRGGKEGETFGVRLADAVSERQESEPPLSIQQYLPQGLATEWREILIPLTDFRGLDLHQLTQLALVFTAPGDYRFHLDRITLKKEKLDAPPLGGTARPPFRSPARAPGRRALWVWTTENLVATPTRAAEQNRFFRFCDEMGISNIYLAPNLEGHEEPEGFRYTSRYDPEALSGFLARAHRQGLAVEALLGAAEWAAREKHNQAQAAILAIKDLNASLPPEARFQGIHFDVEPYLLAGYSSPVYQRQLLRNYLEMIASSAEVARRKAGLRFSCDVPAWFFPRQEEERKRLTVSFQGKEQSVGEHLLDLLDTVTIMAYRHQADGAGGIISFAAPALRAADAKGKRVVVGIETYREPDVSVSFVCRAPADELSTRLDACGLRDQSAFQGRRLHVLLDGDWAYLGLATGAGTSPKEDPELEQALTRLVMQFHGRRILEDAWSEWALDDAAAAITRSPEFHGFEPFEIPDPTARHNIHGFRTVYQMPRHTTFHGLGPEVFTEEVDSALEWLGGHASFFGLAIHHYESFRELMRR